MTFYETVRFDFTHGLRRRFRFVYAVLHYYFLLFDADDCENDFFPRTSRQPFDRIVSFGGGRKAVLSGGHLTVIKLSFNLYSKKLIFLLKVCRCYHGVSHARGSICRPLVPVLIEPSARNCIKTNGIRGRKIVTDSLQDIAVFFG